MRGHGRVLAAIVLAAVVVGGPFAGYQPQDECIEADECRIGEDNTIGDGNSICVVVNSIRLCPG
jgi:hypothetical protein